MKDLWFFEDRARLASERAAIDQLIASADWLAGTNWTINESRLCLNAIIRAHGNEYHIRMEYPRQYPDIPPAVYPANAEFRWTFHQYGGVNGPLCLEWGPDNWQSDINGAQMLESTYRLFHMENPLGDNSAEHINLVAPSRHQLTLGQELRREFFRLYLGSELHQLFTKLPNNSAGTFRFSDHHKQESWLTLVHSLETPQGEVFYDTNIPEGMSKPKGTDLLSTGIYFKTDIMPDILTSIEQLSNLSDVLSESGYKISITDKEFRCNEIVLTEYPIGMLIFDGLDMPCFYYLTNVGSLIKFASISEGPKQARQPLEIQALSTKSIGIVGLGSVGSKIAITLARMGVRSFFLVDSDILLPENIERHELNWSNIGQHKVDGVRGLLLFIGADMQVEVSKTHLTGQETTTRISADLHRLSQCDLIIDATANPNVFNLLAGVATTAAKPFLWVEVFGGGRGGFVARSRPNYDPTPLIMRAAYHRYCEEYPAPPEVVIARYTIEDAEGQVMVGSDAGVSVIANHATLLAADTLLGTEPSAYLYSMYLIGLDKWWVFEQPFHNIPISTSGLSVDVPRAVLEPEADQQELEFLSDLINGQSHGTSRAS